MGNWGQTIEFGQNEVGRAKRWICGISEEVTLRLDWIENGRLVRDVAWWVGGSRALERDTWDQPGNNSGKKCPVIKFG